MWGENAELVSASDVGRERSACGSIFDTPVVDFNDFDEKIENVIKSSLD